MLSSSSGELTTGAFACWIQVTLRVARLGRLCELLKGLVAGLGRRSLSGLLSVSRDGLGEVTNSLGQDIDPIVLLKRPTIPCKERELIEPVVVPGTLALVVRQRVELLFDDSLVHDEPVVVQDRFELVDDSTFLLPGDRIAFQTTGVYLGQDWSQQSVEHAVTEVILGPDLVHVLVQGYGGESFKDDSVVATTSESAPSLDEDTAMQHLGYTEGSFILTAT